MMAVQGLSGVFGRGPMPSLFMPVLTLYAGDFETAYRAFVAIYRYAISIYLPWWSSN
jgi:hypothetical protein